MKPFYIISFTAILLSIASAQTLQAQAFKKGSILISASEGAAYSIFTTSNNNPYNDGSTTDHINGDRDPLIVEYGVSDRWSVGLSSGGDIYRINTDKLYSYETHSKVQAITGDLAAEVNYHFYITKKIDLSGFCAMGLSGISIKGNDGDRTYEYKAGGTIVRLGAKARYYVLGRFGIMAMLSAFSTNLSPTVNGNTMGANMTTTIRGCAWELGLCYRVLR